MRWQIEPMPSWPYPETRVRRSSPFSVGWDDTLVLLERELDALGVHGAVAIRVVGSPADVRRDGMLRANARLAHPGVALSFESRHGPLTYPCDTFGASPSLHRTARLAGWQVNVRAIALALEALRKVDRYGVGGHGEQYRGWRQIEATPGAPFSTAAEARRWLRDLCGISGSPDSYELGVLVRKAKAITHPDRNGGHREDWDLVERAETLIGGAR